MVFGVFKFAAVLTESAGASASEFERVHCGCPVCDSPSTNNWSGDRSLPRKVGAAS